VVLALVVLAMTSPGRLRAQATDEGLRDEASRALKRAATYFRGHAASHGGYVSVVSLDLRRRWGEGEVGPETILVQPPGTPTVGEAFLRAFEATGDRDFLDAARETAEALVDGQLESGGWTQDIHFAPAPRLGKYRRRKGGDWNASSLDDDQTQAALRTLFRVDRSLEFRHPAIHEAALFGVDALLRAQFANGGFPQVWTGPSRAFPAVKARYPEYDWKVEGKVKHYWNCCTLNDGLAGTVADALIAAHRTYGDERCRAALSKLGSFLILAQMPEPQPAWCQQYNDDMVPVWARKFEPPAITSSESQDAMETLIKIARYTGDARCLEPIPRALAYFRAHLLPDGQAPRFYELKTDRPLYMDSAYRLTYDDSDAPSHYGWKNRPRLDAIERAYNDAKAGVDRPARPKIPGEDDVRRIINDLDDQGRWVSAFAGERLLGRPNLAEGERYLSSAVFRRNVETLSDYLAPRRP